MNRIVHKYDAGDKKSIFGRPFTYNGTKWVPDDGGASQGSSGSSSKKISVTEADRILKKHGLEHITELDPVVAKRLLKFHGISYANKKPEDILKELIQVYGAGKGTSPVPQPKPEDKKPEGKKPEIIPPDVKEYSNKNVKTTVPLGRIKNAEPIRGGHWGSARSDNHVALAVAFSSGSTFRPIDKDLKEYSATIDELTARKAVSLRKYAQDRIFNVSRKDHPEIFRGMTLPPEAFKALMDGTEKNIELTGCTAFTFHKEIMERYSKSSWTQSFGRDKKGIKLVLERDDNVDKSIGMWHDHKSDRSKPAFEILTGLDCVTVTRIESKQAKKGKSVSELRKVYEKREKKTEEKLKKEKPNYELASKIIDANKKLDNKGSSFGIDYYSGSARLSVARNIALGRSLEDTKEANKTVNGEKISEMYSIISEAFKGASEEQKKNFHDNSFFSGRSKYSLYTVARETTSDYNAMEQKLSGYKEMNRYLKLLPDSYTGGPIPSTIGSYNILDINLRNKIRDLVDPPAPKTNIPVVYVKAGRVKSEEKQTQSKAS